MRSLKYLALIAAISAAFIATPAMARCHGHLTADGKNWDLRTGSWSLTELAEMSRLAKQVKQINPSSTDNGGTISTIVDQFECSGVSHEDAINNIIGVAKARAELENLSPDDADTHADNTDGSQFIFNNK